MGPTEMLGAQGPGGTLGGTITPTTQFVPHLCHHHTSAPPTTKMRSWLLEPQVAPGLGLGLGLGPEVHTLGPCQDWWQSGVGGRWGC